MNENPFGGGGFQPPDQIVKVWQERIKHFFKKGFGWVLAIILVIILAVNSVYILNSGQEAVITRFGNLVSTENTTGLKFKLPLIDRVDIVAFENLYNLEFGYRSQADQGITRNAVSKDEFSREVPEEATMLTGDLNIVVADWSVIYKVKNSYDWLFRVEEPVNTLRIISESSYRRIVAAHPLDDVLTNKKDQICNEIKEDLQEIADKYQLGVEIRAVQLQDALPPEEVRQAFNDVNSAREEKERKINEASKYENEKIPVAEGQAVKVVNDAEAYKARRINEAQGATARYAAIEQEYSKNPAIMRTRLYLEMIKDVLPKINTVYFVDENGNTLKFLPIGQGSVLPGQATPEPQSKE